MVDPETAREFLQSRRIAVVGASADPKAFGHTVYVALRDHGHDVVAVNPSTPVVAGDRCYPSLDAVPGDVDAVLVMVRAELASDVVRAAAALGIRRVWLFKGLGGPGAVSDEVVAEARQLDMAVVDGACPFMFLEPVRAFHRFHRAVRRLNGSLAHERPAVTAAPR